MLLYALHGNMFGSHSQAIYLSSLLDGDHLLEKNTAFFYRFVALNNVILRASTFFAYTFETHGGHPINTRKLSRNVQTNSHLAAVRTRRKWSKYQRIYKVAFLPLCKRCTVGSSSVPQISPLVLPWYSPLIYY